MHPVVAVLEYLDDLIVRHRQAQAPD